MTNPMLEHDDRLEAIPAAGSSAGADRPPQVPAISLGTKMVLMTVALLTLSFGFCGLATLSLARRMLRSDIDLQVSQESHFLATASQDLVTRASPENRLKMERLADHLIEKPEILAVQIMDRSRHVLVHLAKRSRHVSNFFSLQTSIRSGDQIVGSVRAWYSPLPVLEEFWNTTGHLVLLVLVATYVLFTVVLFLLNDWLLTRPFRLFLQAIDEAESRDRPLRLPARPAGIGGRHDEWGILGERLNRFLNHLKNLQERSNVLYETSRLLGSPVGMKDSLEAVFSNLLHRYNLSSCLIFVETENHELRVDFAAGVSTEFSRSLVCRPGDGLVGVTFASGIPRRVDEIREDEQDALLRDMRQRQQVRSTMLMPLAVEGRVLGTAVYFSQATGVFEENQVQALQLFTQHVAVAFRNGRRMSELKIANEHLETEVAATLRELTQTNARLIQKVRELKTVYDLALATAASTNVQDIVRVIISGIQELVGVQGGAFFLFDKSGSLLEPVMPAFDNLSPAPGPLNCKPEESSFLQQVIQQAKPAILNFVDTGEALPASWRSLAIRSILVLPLLQDEKVKGIFCVVNKVNGLFTDDDVRLLTLLTSRVAEVIHRLGLDQQLRQRVHDLSVLQEISSQLPSPPVLADTATAIGRITRQALPGTDICLFYLYHSPSEALVMVGGDWNSKFTFDARALTVGASEKLPIVDTYRESQPAHYQKGLSPAAWDHEDVIGTFKLQDLLYLPLIVEEGTIGVMAIGSQAANGLTFEHRRLAGLIAKQVSIVIERSRLYERLRSANEKLEQINHLKNEFISMVSHELRTPLTTIKGFVSIVLNEETGPLNDQQRHFLETSDRAIDRLTLLVSDLLDISRIEAGQIKMQLRPTVLKDVVARLAASFTPQLKAQNLTLTVQIPDHTPPVHADPDRLTQVFDNLMSNALKFTSTGGITITAQDKGDYVMVSVKDTGSGIPKDEQDKIFEKFYQVKVGNAWPSKGTGLGLAIVRSIIESHRGKVWVESDSGKGADFRFILPRAREGSGDAPHHAAPGERA